MPHPPVARYFAERFGPVDDHYLREIVPEQPSIDVGICRGGNAATLFTAGMSIRPMTVPQGMEDFQFAELFIQLPPDWPVTDIDSADHGWPVRWLREVAKFPHRQQTSLAGPAVVLANASADDTFGPRTPFTGMLVVAEDDFRSADKQIKAYRLMPLYWEEIQLERRQGLPVLLRRFDEERIERVVDVERRNVGVG